MLYTLEQVQTEIDKSDDPRLMEKLSVEVDAEDRDTILKRLILLLFRSTLITFTYILVEEWRHTYIILIAGRGGKKEGSRAT